MSRDPTGDEEINPATVGLHRKAQAASAARCFAPVVLTAVVSSAATWFAISYSNTGVRGEIRGRYPEMPDYALDALTRRYAERDDFDHPDDTLELRKAKRVMRNQLEGWAASMPHEAEEQANLRRALTFFTDKHDVIDIWLECLTGAGRFQGTSPVQVLHGVLGAMDELRDAPQPGESLRNFIWQYQSLRQDFHLDHDGAIAMIVERRKRWK